MFFTVCVLTNVINIVENLVYHKGQKQTLYNMLVLLHNKSPTLKKKISLLESKLFLLIPYLFFPIFSFPKFYVLTDKELIIILYFNTSILLRCFMFQTFSTATMIELWMVNEELDDLLKISVSNNVINLKVVRAKMEYIRISYLKVKDNTSVLNKSLGWSIFSVATFFVCYLMSTTYWLLLGFIRDIHVLTTLRKLTV